MFCIQFYRLIICLSYGSTSCTVTAHLHVFVGGVLFCLITPSPPRPLHTALMDHQVKTYCVFNYCDSGTPEETISTIVTVVSAWLQVEHFGLIIRKLSWHSHARHCIVAIIWIYFRHAVLNKLIEWAPLATMRPHCVIEAHCVLIHLDHKPECVSRWQARSVEETHTKSEGANCSVNVTRLVSCHPSGK